MILLIDNYDSFVFNVARYVKELGHDVEVIRNDALDVSAIAARGADALIVSPGPCSPDEAGISLPAIAALSGTIPILGICLGHQCIGQAFSGRVVRARTPMHGRASRIRHEGTDVFAGLPSPFTAGRYHSLAVELDGTEPLVATAFAEDGEIMGLAHLAHPTYGVQFHPESVLTEHGYVLLENFLRLAQAFRAGRKRGEASSVPSPRRGQGWGGGNGHPAHPSAAPPSPGPAGRPLPLGER